MKRGGSTVLESSWAELLYGENSTLCAGIHNVQADFFLKIVKRLQESPDEVVNALKESTFSSDSLSIFVIDISVQ
jgi:hypothetical protein